MRLTIYYGWHSELVDAAILAGAPYFIVDNSPAGPWQGNASIAKFRNAGIKFLEYLDGGYEGSLPGPIPNDLASNLAYIQKVATAGAFGIFVDQITSYPAGANAVNMSKIEYLNQISQKAHSLGLKVVLNCGTSIWSDQLMDYCDFINSSEIWNNEPLTASQQKWANRVWLLTQGVTTESRAVELTKAALGKGIGAHYSCNVYGALPDYYVGYMSQIEIEQTDPEEPPDGGNDMSQITLVAPEEVEVGNLFHVDVNIDTVEAFDAGQFDILYDPTNTEFVSVSSGDIGATEVPVTAFNLLETGHLRVVVNVPGVPGISGSGSLADIVFKAMRAGEETTILIEDGFINDNQAVEIPASWEGCVLSFFLTGDFNGDGVVGEDDISYLARIIVGLETGIPAADVNGDGKIDSADITALERMIAGL